MDVGECLFGGDKYIGLDNDDLIVFERQVDRGKNITNPRSKSRFVSDKESTVGS